MSERVRSSDLVLSDNSNQDIHLRPFKFLKPSIDFHISTCKMTLCWLMTIEGKPSLGRLVGSCIRQSPLGDFISPESLHVFYPPCICRTSNKPCPFKSPHWCLSLAVILPSTVFAEHCHLIFRAHSSSITDVRKAVALGPWASMRLWLQGHGSLTLSPHSERKHAYYRWSMIGGVLGTTLESQEQ